MLADGPRLSRDIADEAQEVHSISARTLKRARSDLRIPAQKHGNEWWISLPEHEGDLRAPRPAKSAKSATPTDVGTVSPLDGRNGAKADANPPWPYSQALSRIWPIEQPVVKWPPSAYVDKTVLDKVVNWGQPAS